MASVKQLLKAISGGQSLTIRQRVIFLWWAASLASSVIFAESFAMLAVSVVSFGIATMKITGIPAPGDEDNNN